MDKSLIKFKSVEDWLESVRQRNRKQELTRGARTARLSVMKDYLCFNELYGEPLSPDELMELALKDRKDAMQRLTNYFNWIQGKFEGVEPRKKKLKRNAAITKQAYLRGFYTHNNVVFGKKEFPTPKRIVSEVTRIDATAPIYDYYEDKDELVFRNGLLQQLLANLNLRDQTVVLFLLSTGADATDLFNLRVEFVRGQWKEKRFFWHSNRLKDLEEFKTFFSREATECLKRYVQQERKDARDDEPLFATRKVGRKMNAHTLAINLRLAAEKMGYAEKTNPFRPKRFRHLFRTACGMAHIDPGFTMAMTEHASDISAGYLEKPRGLFLRGVRKG